MNFQILEKVFSLDCEYLEKSEDSYICVINNLHDYGCYDCKKFKKVD